ncbi:MAG TPA: hypothetical protein VG028_03280 [Terriglobia bacterium]|nr:hypothetical protein [Terriglobia bacterium]
MIKMTLDYFLAGRKMKKRTKSPCVLLVFWTAWSWAATPPDVITVELRQATVDAYSRYVEATEARVKGEMARPGRFLYIDGLPPSRRAQVEQQLKHGDIFMDRLETLDAARHSIKIPDGLVHHWIGDVFVPGATLKQAVEFAQDYVHHQDVYKPELIRSKLLSHKGNDFRIFYRLRKHKIITVTLDTQHDVHFYSIDAAHEYSRSASTHITEVDHADQPDESEKPVGRDSGFLWRIDSWWRWEERDGGLYIECESVSLTRDIPTGLGWMIGPFVTSIPKESLQNTMSSTRSALLARMAAARKQ